MEGFLASLPNRTAQGGAPGRHEGAGMPPWRSLLWSGVAAIGYGALVTSAEAAEAGDTTDSGLSAVLLGLRLALVAALVLIYLRGRKRTATSMRELERLVRLRQAAVRPAPSELPSGAQIIQFRGPGAAGLVGESPKQRSLRHGRQT